MTILRLIRFPKGFRHHIADLPVIFTDEKSDRNTYKMTVSETIM